MHVVVLLTFISSKNVFALTGTYHDKEERMPAPYSLTLILHHSDNLSPKTSMLFIMLSFPGIVRAVEVRVKVLGCWVFYELPILESWKEILKKLN